MEVPLFYCLSPACQEELAKSYKRRFRKEFIPPGHRPEIEPLPEIQRLMRENREVKPR